MNHRKLPRVGIYGGSFDPVHCGHLSVAQAALAEMRLDRLLFVPTFSPPHKIDRAPYAHRLAMLRLALNWFDEECFSLSTIEEKLPKPSYSINTVRTLLRQNSAEYFFILGIDAFLDIESWGDYEEIFSLVNMVISPRKGYIDKQLDHFMDRLYYVPVAGGWQHATGKKVFLLKNIPPLVSSSDIKAALQEEQKDEGALQRLPPEVATYIFQHGLYNE